MTYLSWLSMWFEALLGLKINFKKSELILMVMVPNIELLVDVLSCKVGALPSSYLGMPLGARYKSEAVWDGVEEWFRKRLALWKRQYISNGGRVTLIKSTLSNLPLYLMSILPLPRNVCLRLD